MSHSRAVPSPETVARLAERMERCERGVIACGPQDATPDLVAGIATLARRLGWPLVAEPASQLRSGPHTVGAPLFSSADLERLQDAGGTVNACQAFGLSTLGEVDSAI